MKKHGVLKMLALFMPLTFFLMSCGGGGGGSSSTGTSTASGTGSVAVLLADGPADEYEHIYIWVTGVSLIPVEGNAAPVTIFETDQSEDGHPGLRVDLLEFRDQDFVLTVKDSVSAGKYAKIRLEISAIETIGGPCDDNWIKLPSGKIDLKPREPFYLHDGGNISIRLDIDADKSINLHEAGNSGKCIFRPVVFVDIEEGAPLRRCPKIVNGKIVELITGQSGTEGFVIDLDRHRGRLKVELSESAEIFDEEGGFSDPSILKVGQEVKVRGKLADHGVLLASLVIIGELMDLSGEVESTVDAVTKIFLLAPFPGQVITDAQVDVEVQSQTLILLDCDTFGTSEMIMPGMKARVFGKYGNNVLSAVTVILEERKVSGAITNLQDQDSGSLATIDEVDNGPVDVFIPADTPIFLLGGKQLSLSDLCAGQEVRVSLDPTVSDPLTAKVVFVKPEKHVGEVVDIDYFERTLLIDEDRNLATTDDQRIVYVPIGSKILKSEDDDDEQKEFLSFNDIEVKDYIVVFGLMDCKDSSVFNAVFIVVADDFKDDSDDDYDDYDDYLPKFVLDNDVHVYLREGIIDHSLTVRGNNFSLTGQPKVTECDEDDWTSIEGDVEVYGNNAKFTNIKFLGSVRVQGNGTEFINCCFKDGGPIHSN